MLVCRILKHQYYSSLGYDLSATRRESKIAIKVCVQKRCEFSSQKTESISTKLSQSHWSKKSKTNHFQGGIELLL